MNSRFSSFSRDGKKIIYREWGTNSTQGDKFMLGLRVLKLETRKISILITESENLPFFSLNKSRIVFTRKTGATDYDICTMRPEGHDYQGTARQAMGRTIPTQCGPMMGVSSTPLACSISNMSVTCLIRLSSLMHKLSLWMWMGLRNGCSPNRSGQDSTPPSVPNSAL